VGGGEGQNIRERSTIEQDVIRIRFYLNNRPNIIYQIIFQIYVYFQLFRLIERHRFFRTA